MKLNTSFTATGSLGQPMWDVQDAPLNTGNATNSQSRGISPIGRINSTGTGRLDSPTVPFCSPTRDAHWPQIGSWMIKSFPLIIAIIFLVTLRHK